MSGTGRTLDEFEPLWPAEQKLVDWLRAGRRDVCVIGSACPSSDAPQDVRIRANLLRCLILGGCAVPETGVRVSGAYIEGDGAVGAESGGLDLEGCNIGVDIALLDCCLPDLLSLRRARIRCLFLNRSELYQGLSGDRLDASGDVLLNGLKVRGEVRLRGAKLGGSLECQKAELMAGNGEGGYGKALLADGLNVNGDVFLNGLKARGEVRLLGAKLGGRLECSNAELTAGKGEGGGDGNALSADGLDAGSDVFLNGLKARGEVRLLGVKLGGSLECSNAELTADKGECGHGTALLADRLSASGNVFLYGLKARGEVRLAGAKLGGDLVCSDVQLTAGEGEDGSAGDALSADGLDVSGSVFLNGLKARGEVRLVGAKLGGDLACLGARFIAGRNKEGGRGDALAASGLKARCVYMHRTAFRGDVALIGASIALDLDCDDVRLAASGGQAVGTKSAFSVSRAQIGGALYLQGGTKIRGLLRLTNANIGSIQDDAGCWPDEIDLVGCRYRVFVGKDTPVDAEARLKWLGRMREGRDGQDFWPQPYEECARVLREMGHARDAREILIAKERLQRKAWRRQVVRRWGRWIGRPSAAVLWLRDALLAVMIRYGRRPMLAFWWLVGFWVLGVVVFGQAYERDALKPNLPQIQRAAEWVRCSAEEGELVMLAGQGEAVSGLRRPEESRYACFQRQPEGQSYPAFNAGMYSLDTLLPVVSVEMQSYWIPDDRTGFGRWARFYLWFHILVGWALALLAVAGFSGLVKTDSTK